MQSVLPSIVSAVAGLLGVCVGGAIAWIRESLKEKKGDKKELLLLAILVSAHLDRFVDGCVAVAFDDGSAYGQPSGEDGQTYEPTTEIPIFDPLSLEVEWRVLPPALMQRVLSLPHRVEKMQRKLADIVEYDHGPHYEQFFAARQWDFTLLALEVSETIQKLRAHAKLPDEPEIEGEWDRTAHLEDFKKDLVEKRAEQEAKRARSLEELRPLNSSCTG
ncbi:hypothetical protein RJO15_07855 [Herbaspirillum huttiense F1]|uniref:hypothetical protein n=1 Tax=Herbaspirillum huttiense TaxID=863372 RepID=UPI0028859839|nr:hypothetical protein [Herbaspirillum huttiense]MDT0355674.1 hypothetical protein [Herbaspirillum huttiense F1]